MKKMINLVKKNSYFAIFVVVLLFVVTFAIAEYDGSQASHETLYTDVIRSKAAGGTVNVIGGLLVDGDPYFSSRWTLVGNDIYYDGGWVGIGKTPLAKLDVDGDIKATGDITSSGRVCDGDGNCITEAGPEGDNGWTIAGNDIYRDIGNVGIGTSDLSMGGQEDSTSVAASKLVIKTAPLSEATGIKIFNGNQRGFAINVLPDGSWKMFDGSGGGAFGLAQKDGNVVIITSTPSEKLEVVGNILATGTICGTNGCIGTGDPGSDSDWIIVGNNMHSGVSGNIGIGTNAPVSQLTVDEASDANSVISIDSGATTRQYSAVDFYDQGTNVWGIGKSDQNDFYIAQFGLSNRLTIKQGGNVGIGTDNPGTNKLEVVGGSIKATGGLIIETCITGECPGEGARPAAVTGQMWLITD